MAISTMVFGANYLVSKPVNAVELLDGQKAFESGLRLTRQGERILIRRKKQLS